MTSPTPAVQETFSEIEKKMGFVPNLLREMSESMPTLLVYLSGQDALAKGALTPKEQQAVQLTVASVNGCHYCQAAHDWLGQKVGIPEKEIKAIRAGAPLQGERLAGVVDATRLVMEKRGWLTQDDLQGLEAKGVSKPKLYEIVAFIGLKTISNYINHIAHTPVDAEFTT